MESCSCLSFLTRVRCSVSSISQASNPADIQLRLVPVILPACPCLPLAIVICKVELPHMHVLEKMAKEHTRRRTLITRVLF